MRALAVATLLCLALSRPGFAEEPRGCDKFKWSIDAAQGLLAAAVEPAATANLDRGALKAIRLSLTPLAEAHLVKPPERAPKDPASYAGALSFAAGEAGRYRITLSAAAWIDLIQDGRFVSPTAFTGALDCPGVRKSVEFAIGDPAFTLQVSDAASPTISLAITEVK